MNSNLKQLLQERGIAQTKLAELLGRDRSVITHLLQGKRQLKADEATKIADFLGVSVGELLGESQVGMEDSASPLRFEGMPSPEMLHSGQIARQGEGYVLRSEAASSEHEYALQMPDESLNLAGVLKGDMLIADMQLQPEIGQFCIVQHYEGDSAATLIRRFEPPFLTAHSTEHFSPLALEDGQVRVVCAIKRLIRIL